MKLKASILLSSIILSATASAAVITDNKDGTVMIKDEVPSGVKVEYVLDKNSPFAKEPTTYDLKAYAVEATKSLVSTTGVYDNRSPLLDVKGKLLVSSSVVGKPVGRISSTTEKPYIKSVKTEVKDSLSTSSTLNIDAVRTGFDLTAFQMKKNIYSVSIFQFNLEEIEDFEVDGNYVQLPKIKKWKTISDIYIPSGKTARIESSIYSIDGKEYKNVYLLSAKNG